MATRLYLPSGGAAGSTPTARADWERSIAAATHRPMATTKSNTALTDVAALMGSTATSQTRWMSFVSPPLVGDQTITGTVSLIVRCVEGGATEDAHLAFMLRVLQGDTSTERGLLASVMATSTEFATTAATRIHSAVAVASVAALDGDRLVLEVGVHAVTAANALVITERFGDPSATADFALTAGLTTDLCPWVELSQTLVFDYQGAVGLTAPAAALDSTGTVTGGATTGDAALTAPAAAFSGTGTVVSPPVTGTGALAAPAAALDGAAALTFTGEATQAALAPELAASGTFTPAGTTGDAALDAPAPALAGSATVQFAGDGDLTVPAVALAASGTYTPLAITGTATVDTPASALAATGAQAWTGPGTVDAPGPTLAASGTYTPLALTGDGALDTTVPALAASGLVAEAGTVVGTASVAAPAPSLAADGVAGPGPITADGTLAAPAPALAATGAEAYSGTAALAAPVPTLDAAALLGFPGAVVVIVPAPALAGSGTVTVAGAIAGDGTLAAPLAAFVGLGEQIQVLAGTAVSTHAASGQATGRVQAGTAVSAARPTPGG